tara:strand:- start:4259 stop:4510 length:252 start_codon:yes stop_codon:yes gene_type:complete
MKISKTLKHADFEYDEESKSFTIIDTKDGGAVELNKVYAFAFMRFVVRMAQRNWFRTKKVIDKTQDDVLESEPLDHPNQLNMF